MGTSAPAVKNGVYQSALTLFAGDPRVVVSYGIVIPTGDHDGLAIGNISTAVSHPVLGRTARDEIHQITVLISVFRAVPANQQHVVTDRAYDILDQLAEYYRAHTNELPGVPVRSNAWITSYELDEFADNEALQAKGRGAGITAVLTVEVRLP